MTTNELPINDGSQEPQDQTSGLNSSASESSSSSAKMQQPMSDAEKAKAIDDLLNGVDDEPEQGDDEVPSEQGELELPDDGDEPSSKPGPLSVAEIAEKLGVEPEDVYNLEIPTRDGEPVTLGNLKDAYQNRQQAERENAQRQSDLNERESRIISDQQIWSVLASQGHVPQAQIERAQAAIKQRLQAETETLLQLVPEFADNDKREQFRRDAVRTLGSVGFQPHEVNMADHRHVLFVRKFIQMENDLKNAKAEVKRLTKKEPPKTAKSNGRPLQSRSRVNVQAASRGSESQKVDAVSKLLGG